MALGFAEGSTVPGAAAAPSQMEMLLRVAPGQDHPLTRRAQPEDTQASVCFSLGNPAGPQELSC